VQFLSSLARRSLNERFPFSLRASLSRMLRRLKELRAVERDRTARRAINVDRLVMAVAVAVVVEVATAALVVA
jgi:hypothetical protein